MQNWYQWKFITCWPNLEPICWWRLSNECNLSVSMWINGRGRYDHIFSYLRESSVFQSKIKTSSLLHSYTFSTLQYFWNISCCAFAFYNFSPLFMTRSLCGRPIFLYGPAPRSRSMVGEKRVKSKWKIWGNNQNEKKRTSKILFFSWIVEGR